MRKTCYKTYEEFLKYLLAKDERLAIAKLPFEGRNQVVFMFEGRGGELSQPAAIKQMDVVEESGDQNNMLLASPPLAV
jgi:hypothetical protein